MRDGSIASPSCDRFERGLRAYEIGAYFEAHEHFEALWLVEEDPARKLGLKGLVLIAVAMHKVATQKNARVGARLFRRALAALAAAPRVLEGIAIDSLCELVAHRASELDDGAAISAPRLGRGSRAER